MLAEARALALPAADADVDVVALREDPAVAAGDRAQLERSQPAVAVLRDGSIRDVPLKGHAVDGSLAEAEGARRRPVRAVGADERRRHDPVAADLDGDAPVFRGHLLHLDSVPEVSAGGRGLLGEVMVETAPLRHQDQRL